MPRPKFKKDYYVYVADFGSLAAGATQTEIINIETDADFIIEKIAYSADLAGAVQTANSRVLPLVDITLNDSGSGRNLQDKPVPLASMAGDGQLPYVLPVPRKLRANSNLNVSAENISNATQYDHLRVLFIGYKRFNIG